MFFARRLSLCLWNAKAISEARSRNPNARVFVVGLLASVMPEAFSDLDVTIVRGEAEQLYWKLDEVLERPAANRAIWELSTTWIGCHCPIGRRLIRRNFASVMIFGNFPRP